VEVNLLRPEKFQTVNGNAIINMEAEGYMPAFTKSEEVAPRLAMILGGLFSLVPILLVFVQMKKKFNYQD